MPHLTDIQLLRMLKRGEGPRVEFKEARDALPRDLFETVCAFLNRDGGTILLGVADDGTVTRFSVRVRIDTPEELVAYKHGGIMPYVVRQLVKG